MTAGKWLRTAITYLVIGFAIAVAAGAITGHPITLGYVETTSMEPALAPGDGFIAVSPLFAPPAEQGDVIVFESGTMDTELTTHRIVGRTPEGFITRGDNSPFTDQATGEPPVRPPQIVGRPITINGQILSIPWYGSAVETIQGALQSAVFSLGLGQYPGAQVALGLLVVGVGVVLLTVVYGAMENNQRQISRRNTRSTIDSRVLLLIILIIVAVPLITMLGLAAETQQFTMLSSPGGTGPNVVAPGGTHSFNFTVENRHFVPMVVIMDVPSGGASVSQRTFVLSHDESAKVRYTVVAPTEVGRFNRYKQEVRYPHVLPIKVLEWLHDRSPVLAGCTVVGVLLSPIILLFYFLIGFRTIRLVDTSHR